MATSRLARNLINRNIRSIQTSADTTKLKQQAPSDPSAPFTVRLHQDSFRSHQCESPDLDVTVTKDQLLLMYRQMQTMRRMEMAADALYKAKLIRGFCHLAIGQVRLSKKKKNLARLRVSQSFLKGSCVCWFGTWYSKR